MSVFFKELDLNHFWEESDYYAENCTEPYPTDEMIVSVEKELGYKLPASYIELMKSQNGGEPKNTCFATSGATSWAEDYVAISSIFSIGRDKSYSLCGDTGSQFMIEEWGYPPIGIIICDCPSGGHDVVMLDYRKCGSEGEPEVVHVDQEDDYKITFLAQNFEHFIQSLQSEEMFDDED